MRFFSLAIIAATACSPIGRPPEPPRKIKVAADISPFEVGNGIVGVVAPDPNADTVTVVARYQVGSTLDPQGKSGLAHLVEHLMYQHRFGQVTLGQRLAEVSLGYNAVTEHDTTTYYTTAEPQNLEKVLKIEAERLVQGCATLTEEIFLREREVVRNEIRNSRSARAGDLPLLIAEATFPADHPYRRTVGGDDKQLVDTTLSDVCTFIEKNYGPQSLTISVVGKVTNEQLGAALGKSFGRVPKRTSYRSVPADPIPASQLGHLKSIETDVDLPYAIVLFRMPPPSTPERVAADMAMDFARQRAAGFADTYEFATGVYPFSVGSGRSELSGVAVELRSPGDANEAFDAVWKAFGKVDNYFSQVQFDRLVAIAQTDLMFDLDSPIRKALKLAEYRERNSERFFFGDLELIGSTSRDGARDTAGKLFVKSNSVALLVKPSQAVSRRYKRAAPSFVATTSHSGDRFRQDASGETGIASVATLPRRLKKREFELDNGIRVVLAPTSAAALVQVRVVIGAGRAAEPKGQSGIASIAANFLEVNFTSTSDVEVAAAYKFFRTGGRIDTSLTDDLTQFTATGLEVYLDFLIEGIERYVRASKYDNASIQRFVSAQKASLSTRGSRESRSANQTIYAETFGATHPYATRGFWRLEELGNLGSSAATSFRSKHYVGANTAIVVTGKFDVDLVEEHVRYHFDSWPRGSATAQVTQAPERRSGNSPRAVVIDSNNSEVVGIDVTFPLSKVIGTDLGKLMIIENMLASHVGIVRNELGASYGFGASLLTTSGPGMLHISGKVDATRAGAALIALLGAIDGLRSGADGFSSSALQSRAAVSTSLRTLGTTTSGTGGRIAFYLGHRLDSDFDRKLATEIAKTTTKEVSTLAAKVLEKSQMRVILTGTKTNVNAALAQANLEL